MLDALSDWLGEHRLPVGRLIADLVALWTDVDRPFGLPAAGVPAAGVEDD